MSQGSLIKEYDYKKPIILPNEIPTWESDYYTFKVPLPKGNFTRLEEVTIQSRLVARQRGRDTAFNTSDVEFWIEFTILERFDRNGQKIDIVLAVDNDNALQRKSISTYKYNYAGKEFTKYHFNGRPYSENKMKGWFKLFTSYATDGNLTEEQRANPNGYFTIRHNIDGKANDMRIEYSTTPILFSINANNPDFYGVYDYITSFTIPAFEYIYTLSDFDWVPDIQVASRLSTDARNNIVSPKPLGTKFSKYKKYSKQHDLKHTVSIDIANHYEYIIQLSKKNDKVPITQSYTNVLKDAILEDDFTLNWFRDLIDSAKRWGWKNNANLSKKQYWMRQGNFWKMWMPAEEKYVDCIITLRTQDYVYNYTYKMSDGYDANDLINYINEISPTGEPYLQQIGLEKAFGLYGSYKAPKVKVKLVYNKPFYLDGVKLSPDSYLELEYMEDGDFDEEFFANHDFKLQFEDPKTGSVKSKKPVKYKNDTKITLTDEEAEKFKNNELVAFPNFSGVAGDVMIDVSDDSNLSGNLVGQPITPNAPTDNDVINKYLTPITLDTTKKLSVIDYNATTVNATGNSSIILQNNSKIRVTIPAGFFIITAPNGIASMTVTLDNEIKTATYSANYLNVDFTTSPKNWGTQTLELTYTDKEGVTNIYRQDIYIERYLDPILSANIIYTNVAENIMEIELIASLSNFGAGNSLTDLKYRYKLSTSSSYPAYVSDGLTSAYFPNNSKIVYKSQKYTIQDSKSYLENTFDFEIVAKDKLGKEIKTTLTKIGLGVPLLFFDETKNSTGFNCFPQKSDTATFKSITFDNQETEIISEGNVLKINKSLILDNVDILQKIADLEREIQDLKA